MKNKPVSTSEWLQDKLEILDKMTGTLHKISPEVFTPLDHDYGFWSLKKEIALMYLARPFQNIAKKHFSSHYYIDLFAGSGLMKVAEDTFYAGSPVVAIGSTIKEKPFSKYICMEAEQNRCSVLQQRLEAVCTHYQTCKADVVPANTNAEIDNVLNKYAPKGDTCYLAFVDPETYTDINWSTLETLMRFGKGDIILNFPSHSIVRNLPTKTSAGAVTSLSKFVGDSDWASS
jgi:three-Cys-motif partner protein